MKHVSMHGRGYEALKDCLAHREPFVTSGALRARTGTIGSGRLPRVDEYFHSLSRAQYVVYSYDTPIAWVDENGEVRIPDEKYSITTSRHQGIVRSYLK